MVEFEVPEVDLSRYTNRQLAAVPLAVLAVALFVLLGWSLFVTGTTAEPGPPVTYGIDFTGGTEMRIATTDSPAAVRAAFDEELARIQPVAATDDYILLTQSTATDDLSRQATEAGYEVEYVQTKSPSFGAESRYQAVFGVLVAFAGMSILVFVLFRTFVPSIAVVISAFSDIMIPMALMNVFGIELTLGTVAALLMLIGYSVDSDILLNNHVLKRRGGFYESAYRAMQTGVTMTVTSISAMVVMFLVGSLLAIPLLPDIAIVLVFGLTADLMNTYMLNMSLLRWYKYEGVAR